MKATVIISQEYRMNAPSIFMKVGKYYVGDSVYPQLRRHPQDVNYWRGATSSDSDRGFNVSEAEVSEDVLQDIIDLQFDVEGLKKRLIKEPLNYVPKTWRIKRGKAYEQWLRETREAQSAYAIASKHNEPYYKMIQVLLREQKKLICNTPSDSASTQEVPYIVLR